MSVQEPSATDCTAVLREAWTTLPESSSRPLPATLAQSRNLAHASLKTAVFVLKNRGVATSVLRRFDEFYYFCLNLLRAFSQPRKHSFGDSCKSTFISAVHACGTYEPWLNDEVKLCGPSKVQGSKKVAFGRYAKIHQTLVHPH